MKFLDLTNKKFGKLTVIKLIGKWFDKNGKQQDLLWECICECGNKKIVRRSVLKSGYTNSCGCLKNVIVKHSLSKNRFYSIHQNIKQRCINNKHNKYKHYGGKGITVCDEWLKFENFYRDMFNEYINHLSIYGEKDTTIDRIDNNKGYSKENCRWATRIEQIKNRSKKYLTKKNI